MVVWEVSGTLALLPAGQGPKQTWQTQTGGLHLQGSRARGAVAPREGRETRSSGPSGPLCSLALWPWGPGAHHPDHLH